MIVSHKLSVSSLDSITPNYIKELYCCSFVLSTELPTEF